MLSNIWGWRCKRIFEKRYDVLCVLEKHANPHVYCRVKFDTIEGYFLRYNITYSSRVGKLFLLIVSLILQDVDFENCCNLTYNEEYNYLLNQLTKYNVNYEIKHPDLKLNLQFSKIYQVLHNTYFKSLNE